jgi:hypothetical protein
LGIQVLPGSGTEGSGNEAASGSFGRAVRNEVDASATCIATEMAEENSIWLRKTTRGAKAESGYIEIV